MQAQAVYLESEPTRPNFHVVQRHQFGEIVGTSAAMQKVFSVIERVARSNTTVLISGRTGTGKELVARAIHNLSSRASRPFIDINCGALPPELVESEFFGHQKGAFTGAIDSRKGLFESADGSTIFLDEVQSLRRDLQAKLLRVLQEQSSAVLADVKTYLLTCG